MILNIGTNVSTLEDKDLRQKDIREISNINENSTPPMHSIMFFPRRSPIDMSLCGLKIADVVEDQRKEKFATNFK